MVQISLLQYDLICLAYFSTILKFIKLHSTKYAYLLSSLNIVFF